MTRHVPDIDIDFFDRTLALQDLFHIPASIIKNDQITKHNTAVYFQDIPIDPISGLASIDHITAEQLGYIKFDFLNLKTYENVKNENHLIELMEREPLWEMLEEKSIVDLLFHLNGNFNIVSFIKPKTIEDLAVVVAIKMPNKRYLLNKSRQIIDKEIWLPAKDSFKRCHAIAYAMVIVVQMNLMMEQLDGITISNNT